MSGKALVSCLSVVGPKTGELEWGVRVFDGPVLATHFRAIEAAVFSVKHFFGICVSARLVLCVRFGLLSVSRIGQAC